MEKTVVENMLADLNRNLASGKRTLEEFHDSGDRTFKVRDGTSVEIPMDQIEFLWNVCDDSERIRLRLPIYVSTDISSDAGAWKVEGRTEAAVVSKVIGRKMYRDDMVRLYYPDLKELKSRIGGALMMVFTP